MKKEENMRVCRYWHRTLCMIAVLVLPAMHIWSQDVLPEVPDNDIKQDCIAPLGDMRSSLQLVSIAHMMPTGFKETMDNKIDDPNASLDAFFEKLEHMDRPIRIVHIGDSHVRGHIFPYMVRQLLEADFGKEAVRDIAVDYRTSGIAHETGKPGLVYHIIGVNGATCATYNTPERIKEVKDLNPDLIISSFGTNEAHSRYYTSGEFLLQMESLLATLRNTCPSASILMTTPPGAYVRKGGQRIINTRTPKVVETQKKFSRDYKIALWDMYDIVGGAQSACLNWTSAKMYQRDKIHFTAEGYKLQGMLLHEAFIKAYNDYVAASFN